MVACSVSNATTAPAAPATPAAATTVAAAAGAAAATGITPAAAGGKVVVAVSEGWGDSASAVRYDLGFKEGIAKYGWDATYSQANFDPKLQSEQIDAFIKLKPAALFVTCSDPSGIVEALNRAIAAGIPVFTADCYVSGVRAITQIASNNFGMGAYTMSYIMKAIGGTGKIGMIGLPENETWNEREFGARYVLTNYPNVSVVWWPYDSTGAVTPGQAITNMMTANPDIKAIWCAWEDCAMSGGLEAVTANRSDMIFTGIDGSKASFTQIQAGGPFKLVMAQDMYWMSWMDVYYANQYLFGNHTAPRFIGAPVYAVTKEVLDALPANVVSWDYDKPGMNITFGWQAAQ
jgi:ribose transport system substrate-binding protein